MPKPTYKQLEQRLKELEEAVSKRGDTDGNLVQRADLLSAYFDSAPLLTYHVGLDGVIVDCNLTVVRTLGYRSKAELIGRPLISTIYARPFQEKARRLLEKWKAEGSLRNEEMQVVTKHGDLKTVLLNADTLFDRKGMPVYSLSTHLDITDRVIAKGELGESQRLNERRLEALLQLNEQLSRQAVHLNEVNTALKVLVDHRGREREEFSRQILANVRKLVFPYLEKLDRVLEKPENKTCLEIAKSNLMELVRPLAAVAPLTRLSPAELQVADMVKYGKTSKEIATVLHLSEETVRFHRKNIRKKLEINKQSVNLRSYLMSLSER